MSQFFKEKSSKKEISKYDELEQLVWDFFMNKIPSLGFESREGQEDMALDICSAIKERQHTIIEAGVGIGKSYAYIVPLLYYNMLFEKTVLIATSTIALQEQLIKDIKRICNYIKYKPEIVLAKGMTHFVCKERADIYFENVNFAEISEEEELLYRYIDSGKSDRKNINVDIDEALWEEVNVKATDHMRCKYYNSCGFMELRKRMQECKGVIICNQDLLTVHLEKLKKGQKGLLNEEIDLIVIDEAHNLEEKVRNSLIKNYNFNKIKSVVKEAISNIENRQKRSEVCKMMINLNSLLVDIFKDLDNQIRNQDNKQYRFEEIEKYFVDFINIKEKIRLLIKSIKSIYNDIQFYSRELLDEDSIDELENLLIFLESTLHEDGKELFWLEKREHIEIFSCPKEIDKQINSLFFDDMKTTILTSATLANKNIGTEKERYEYLVKTIGFPTKKGFLAAQKNSPFPYDENTVLYYAENMPHPTYEREEFIKKATEEIVKLLDITQGKALILFTAKKDLNDVYEILKEKNLNYNLIKQRKISSQDEIIEEFKSDKNSVLLATGTFWEGIDVPGEALSNVIIFKLPFPVPDPIIEEKRKNFDNFLMEVSVPLMIVKLRQGVGRLIRKYDDKGIVSILDSRIGDASNNEYKDIVFDSLPVKNKTNDIKKVKSLWKKINSN